MTQQAHPALFNLGFRPFFMGASVFAIFSIGYWLMFNQGFFPLDLNMLSPFQWHAHEMVFGYSLAVIVGFLLTAVKNWTGQQTPHGFPLIVLFSLWLIARGLWLYNINAIFFAAIFDLLFITLSMIAIAKPIIATKKWRQLAILAKLILLGAANLVFYLSLLGYIDNQIHLTIYAGLYLIIGLILTVGRRIIPLFVESGVNETVTLFNAKWLDISSLICFLTFFITVLFFTNTLIPQLAASLMVIITTIRIVGWYTPGVWKSPLLWSFYIALFFIDLGFLLFALSGPLQLSPFLSTHAFAVGGIGVITMGMMARVSIGHTGRSLKKPPARLLYALILLTLAAIVRVIIPAFTDNAYFVWVNISGILWLLSFTLFCSAFVPIWIKPRIDSKYG
jgi:uncharacterized protein involved in response to NO